MHKINNRPAPSSFLEKSEQPSHSYPTSFSMENYRKPQMKLCKCRFWFSTRYPTTWNNLVEVWKKKFNRLLFFKTKMKNKLLKGAIMQIEKTLINDRLRVSEVPWKFGIPTIFNLAVIYLWSLLFSLNEA